MPAPDEASAATNLEIFQDLTNILAMLASNMRTQVDAASQVAMLVPRAEELASNARALAVARAPGSGVAAAALVAELGAFTDETERLAQGAAREAAASRAAGGILKGQADEMNAVARTLDGVNDKAAVRARLRSVLETLAALPARLKTVTDVAADVASLGGNARDLADLAPGLQANVRNPSNIAMTICRGLRDFADTAATVAASMADDAERVRQSIGSIGERATQMAPPEAALEARRNATAVGRMQTVVAHGASAQRSLSSPGAVVWGG
jgi:hypothetical protein